MATEVGGGPLKFTVTVDTKRAEREMDKFSQYAGQSNKRILQSMSGQYRSLMGDALSAFNSMDGASRRYYQQLAQLRSEKSRLTQTQRDLDKSLKFGTVTQSEYLQGSRALAVQTNQVNARLSALNAEIRRNEQVERLAIGSIAQKTARLTQLRKEYDNLSAAQRANSNVGGRMMNEIQSLSKEITSLNAGLTGKSKGIGAMLGSVRGLAAGLGIAFGAQQLVSFGRELFNIARQAEGVSIAFDRMAGDNAENLDKLRKATKGTVADLELMKLAVRAENFKIPMDVLAKGLAFARQRANDTGQSVDYLVNSFVDGIGRQSKLVLDNLGISANELSKEIEKTGDFATAAGNIIDREFSKAGTTVDTFGDRVNRLGVGWDNLKLKMSTFFADLAVEVSDIVGSDSWGEFWNRISSWGKGDRVTQSKNLEAIYNQVRAASPFTSDFEVVDSIRKGANYNTLLAEATNYYNQITNARKEYEAYVNAGLLKETKNTVKHYKDVEAAALDRLETIKRVGANYGLEEKAVKKVGVSINELREKQKQLTEDRDKEFDPKKIADYNKQIEALNKQIDSLSGRGRGRSSVAKKEAEKLQEQIKKDKEAFDGLLKSIAEVGSKYTDEIITKEQQEINSVIDDYDKLIAKAEEYNKTTKAEKIDINNIRTEQGLAVNRVISRQEKIDQAKREEEAEKERKRAYDEAVKLAETIGQTELAIRKKYQDAYAALGDKATNEQKEQLKKGLQEELSQLFMGDLQGSGDWSIVFEKIMNQTREGAQQAIETLKTRLQQLLNEGKITAEEFKDVIEQINGIELDVSLKGKPFADLKKAIKEYRNAKDDLTKSDALGALGEVANQYFQGALEAARDLNGIFDQLNIGSDRFRENFAGTVDLLSNAGNLAASIASGNVVGIITNGVKTLASAINLFSKDKKFERQIKEYQRQLDSLGRSFAKLQDQISNSVGEDFYKDSRAAIDNLKQRQQVVQSMLRAEQSKKKTDSQKVAEYRNELDGIDRQIKDIERTITETLVQTTFKSLSDELANALVSAFEAGEDAIESMDKVFDQFIKNALINSLKLKYIEPIIDEMIKSVSDYMQANNNSLLGYDFERWKKRLDGASAVISDALGTAYEQLGLTKDGEVTSSLKPEGIERITEHSAQELIGLQRASLDVNKQQLVRLEQQSNNGSAMLALANNKLAALNAIEINTANTVVELRTAVIELKGINKAVSGKYGG